MKQLLLFLLFIPSLLMAQEDQKYLAGAIPEEGGKICRRFRKGRFTISCTNGPKSSSAKKDADWSILTRTKAILQQ